MRLLEFIHYMYRNQKNKLLIAIFIIALIIVRLVSLGVDATTLLGFILGLAFLMLMGRQKAVRTIVILVGMPCILLATIAGYHPQKDIRAAFQALSRVGLSCFCIASIFFTGIPSQNSN